MQSHRDIIRRATGAKAREQRTIWRSAVVLAVILVIILVGWLIYYPRFWLTELEITGLATMPESVVRELADTVLAGKYFWLIPKRNNFLYPRADLIRTLHRNLPTIQSVEVKVIDWHRLQLNIIERKSDFLWCRGQLGEELRGATKDCYFMDQHGFVYSPAPAFSGSAFDELYTPFAGNPVGKRYFLDERLQVTRQLIGELVGAVNNSVLGSSTVERIYYLGTDHLTFIFWDQKRENQWRIYAPLSASSSETINNFISAVGADVFRNNFKQTRGSLEYIDLRYGRKIFYRFKN